MNNKTVTSTLAMLLSVACVGAQQARAQDAADLTDMSDSQPPADGQSPVSDAPAPEDSTSAPAEASSTEAAAPAEATPYDTTAEDSSAPPDDGSSESAPPPPPKGVAIRWGAQIGYMLPTDPQPPFEAASWLPIGLELGLGKATSPFAFVAKVDGSPVCFGDDDCSGMQFRGLAGLEVGIQKAADSVLHMVYLNASLGYRYAQSEVKNEDGVTTGKLSGESILVSDVSASMMIPVSHNFSMGPRVALISNLTSDTPEGVSMVELGLRIIHAPGR